MKKTLLFESSKLIENEAATISMGTGGLNYLNNFLKEYKLGKLSHDKVHEIAQNPQEAIKNLFKSKIPAVDPNTGLKNNKDKVLDRMEIPVIDPLQLASVRQYVKDPGLFDYGESVTLNEVRLQKHLDKFRYYSDNAEIIKVYDELNSIADLLNKVNEKLKFMPLGYNIGGLTGHDYNLSEILVITPEGFKVTREGFQKAVLKLKN